jgi:hypothetical protein
MFYVQKNCSPIIIPPSATATPCATGTNAAIQYSLLNLTSKVNIDPFLFPQISMDGTNMWSSIWDNKTNTVNRVPITYNSLNNSLTIGQINYTTTFGEAPLPYGYFRLNTSGLSDYNSYVYGDNAGALTPYNGNYDSVQSQIAGLDGIIYSGTYSKGINLPQYVYTVNQATNQITSPLPAPVAFAGLYSALYHVDKDSNLFGLNGDNDGTHQKWGCFTKNGAGYNNWVQMNLNGLTDFRPLLNAVRFTSQGLYSQARTDPFGPDHDGYCEMQSFFNGTCSNSITSSHLMDLNKCELSKTNYLVNAGIFVFNGWFSQNYIIINSFTSANNLYVLPISKFSNGLDGQ